MRSGVATRQFPTGSVFVRPGAVTGHLGRHETGALLSVVDTGARFYDSTAARRRRAMDGAQHGGTLVHDPRSDDRTTI